MALMERFPEDTLIAMSPVKEMKKVSKKNSKKVNHTLVSIKSKNV